MTEERELTTEEQQAILSQNPRPATPRPPMTFLEQAMLIEFIHGRCVPDGREGYVLTFSETTLDRSQIDDLWLTAQRLRRMAAHERAIRELVTGRE